jgi:hypothetical protein
MKVAGITSHHRYEDAAGFLTTALLHAWGTKSKGMHPSLLLDVLDVVELVIEVLVLMRVLVQQYPRDNTKKSLTNQGFVHTLSDWRSVQPILRDVQVLQVESAGLLLPLVLEVDSKRIRSHV